MRERRFGVTMQERRVAFSRLDRYSHARPIRRKHFACNNPGLPTWRG
jgi:hypothetical protein